VSAVRVVPALDEVEDGHACFDLRSEATAIEQLALAFEFVKAHQARYPVRTLCKLLGAVVLDAWSRRVRST
jgi:hypothetical protein